MNELFDNTPLELKIKYVQESDIVTESCDRECLTDTIDWIKNDMYTFIKDNQDKIKKVYEAINNSIPSVLEDIPELNYVISEYEAYSSSMIDYIKKCINIESNEILIPIKNMQEKDKVFFNNNLRTCEQGVADAMENVETIIDLKRIIESSCTIFNEIKNSTSNTSELKYQLCNFYCKSVITFSLKMLEEIKKIFNTIWATVDSYEKPMTESSKNYRYF